MEDKNDDIINETEKLEEEQNKEEFVLKELEEEQNKEKFVHEEIEESKKEEKDTADKIIEVVDNMVNTKDLTASFSLDDVELNKKYAILCYIGFLFLYPMTKKEIRSSSYMLFHINQGINLFIFDIIVFVICGILNSMFTKVYAYSSSTPILVSFICYMLYCLAIILSLYGVINTFNGKSRELPVIFNFNLIK